MRILGGNGVSVRNPCKCEPWEEMEFLLGILANVNPGEKMGFLSGILSNANPRRKWSFC
jgi:hypothetical protein